MAPANRNKSDAVASRNFAPVAGNSNSGLHNSRSGQNNTGSHRFGQQQKQQSGPGSNNSVLFQPMPALRFPYPPPPIVRRSASSSAPVSKGGNGGGSIGTWQAFEVAQKNSDAAGVSNAAEDDRFKGFLLPVPRTVKGR